jgi:hypothetical protein
VRHGVRVRTGAASSPAVEGALVVGFGGGGPAAARHDEVALSLPGEARRLVQPPRPVVVRLHVEPETARAEPSERLLGHQRHGDAARAPATHGQAEAAELDDPVRP